MTVDDVEAAKDFYGRLFGWTFTQATPPGIPALRHRRARRTGRRRHRWTRQPTGTPSGVWNTYVAVDDIDATVASVERREAAWWPRSSWPAKAVGTPPSPIRPAWSQPVAGQATTRRPDDQHPGAWNFSDLHAADPAASKQFYEQVFGWVFGDMGFATMIQVPGYGDHLAATVDPASTRTQATARQDSPT